ncbi:hypothetical protein [Georgenia thermotolerans]|uniref:Uncharacterized protein n=1 Tax=Georgenia thermotolerans TaxID=527326 RepID=A0A7J5URU9_9MICO|nr:hypothetical protein [Georgenia thermotolerans]KAE8765098.1 hypothetical protein GB883_05800 [Georgenia thermotolerans]
MLSVATSTEPAPELYVRDALGLDTTAEPTSPPRLDPPPPDRRHLLGPAERVEASAQWPRWWRETLRLQARFHDPDEEPRDVEAWLRAHAEERGRLVGEPPDFAGLASSPALRRAVVALHTEAVRWRPHRARPEFDEAGGLAADAREVAESVMAAHDVAPDQVRGSLLGLAVPGTWWVLVEPGVIACSLACLEDADLAPVLVREAFESRLRGGPAPRRPGTHR